MSLSVLGGTAPAPGQKLAGIVAGAYVLEEVLGVGGVGVVVRARRIADGREVAIKLLRSAQDETLAHRMHREAEAAASIRGPRFVEVLELGHSEPGIPFIVMECLKGETLAARLSRGPMPVDECVRYVLETCEGLAAAHARGVIHRDIKPSNVFLVLDGLGGCSVKILDLGISMIKPPDGDVDLTQLTTASVVLGTPAFASPEQLTAPHEVDARTDIWSLGVMLYSMLAGVRPFTGDSLPQLCASVFNATPRRLSEVRGDVPGELADVVARCLEKDRKERFSDVTSLARALQPFARPLFVAGSDVAVASPQPRRRRALGIASGVALAIVGVTSLLWLRTSHPMPAPSASVPLAPPADSAAEVIRAPTRAPEPAAAVPRDEPTATAPRSSHPKTSPIRRRPPAAPVASTSSPAKDLGSYR